MYAYEFKCVHWSINQYTLVWVSKTMPNMHNSLIQDKIKNESHMHSSITKTGWSGDNKWVGSSWPQQWSEPWSEKWRRDLTGPHQADHTTVTEISEWPFHNKLTTISLKSTQSCNAPQQCRYHNNTNRPQQRPLWYQIYILLPVLTN